jgi:hypothetical protein
MVEEESKIKRSVMAADRSIRNLRAARGAKRDKRRHVRSRFRFKLTFSMARFESNVALATKRHSPHTHKNQKRTSPTHHELIGSSLIFFGAAQEELIHHSNCF